MSIKPIPKPYAIGQTIVYKDEVYFVVDVYRKFIAVTDKSGWLRKLIYACCYYDVKVVQ